MAELTTAKEHLIMSLELASGSSSSGVLDDDFEDSCSICLESFTIDDPATLTTCKHEYHLHCILEWSQRSKECPICWQSLALKDPVSQELLAAVEIERNTRRRHISTNGPTYPRQHVESDSEYGSHWTNDPDIDERIMQHLAAVMSRVRQAHRNERPRTSERSPPPVIMFPSYLSESTMHPNSPEECDSGYGSSGGSSRSSSISSVDAQPPSSPNTSFVNLSSGSVPKRDIHYHSSESPDTAQRPRSSELLAFSESLKSRLSATSARYKDSISKGTQGFREKFFARNNSVKELSKGVQREMSASISGVARMIERLELKSKRNSHSDEGLSHVGETSNFFAKGKGVLDNIIANSRENRVVIDQDLSSHEQSQATCSVSSEKKVFSPEAFCEEILSIGEFPSSNAIPSDVNNRG